MFFQFLFPLIFNILFNRVKKNPSILPIIGPDKGLFHVQDNGGNAASILGLKSGYNR